MPSSQEPVRTAVGRAPAPRQLKHVVSVSLGSSKRTTHVEMELLGKRVLLERRATDGDVRRAGEMIRELDGKVDAIGLGGLDIFLKVGERRYEVRDGRWLADQARITPVVCGAGLKDTLDRMVVDELDAVLCWRERRVLMVAALDRFGMAETLAARGAQMVYGDAMFALGVPLTFRDARTLARVARVLLPPLLLLPFSWLYPTGTKQTDGGGVRGRRYFDWADVIAGDFHIIKRYAPKELPGKVILTNTTTQEDVELLKARGVKTLITATPRFDGRSLATNLLEAAFVAVAGNRQLTSSEYRELIRRSGIKPDVLELA